ncbi:MAG: L,D-transpeptidase family protein [Prevotella sp.]|nr:L,D-transpeptidase family protein [Prevotella sp.]
MAFLLQSCHEKTMNPNLRLSLADYEKLDTFAYTLNSHRIREEIDSLRRNDEDSMFADVSTRSYYVNNGSFVWISRKGVDARADSLVACLQGVEEMGFSRTKFQLNQIEPDLQRIKTLDFDESDNRINKVAARLEYNLTKAFLRYAIGQKFGFINPASVFNHLDALDQDSDRKAYRTLFDLKIPHADRQFVELALHKVHVDSVGFFLRETAPSSNLYHTLLKLLHTPQADQLGRSRVLVNMERSRWRLPDVPQAHQKYVLVNIPSFHLQAVNGDEILNMRIAFGSFENKTPLMISQVKRMDINPQWIIPKSIVRKSILPQVGNSLYFHKHQYFVRHRRTGKLVPLHLVSRDMLLGGDYLVAQRGGEGNALGRIIFRFDNNLSIYLHDTSSRDVFGRSNRDVSHGCVRVEKPYDLAVFLLADKDERLLDKISYSMNADVSPLGIPKSELTEKMREVLDTLQRKRLIGQVEVKPRVPIFIFYFTLYPGQDGTIASYDDVYGYDPVIYKVLKNYI